MKYAAMLAAQTLALAVVGAGGARAAEVKVLASNAVRTVLQEIGPQFEKATENRLATEFGLSAAFKPRIEKGEAFDLTFLPPNQIDDLIKQGKVAADSRAVIAKTGNAIMVRAGAPKPDLSTTEAFKRALLNAKSIAYAKEGLSGVYFVARIEKLGMTAALKDKSKVMASGELAAEAVAHGEAEIGILPVSEILPVHGVEVGGAFPAELQSYVVIGAGVSAAAKQGAAARELIKYLTSPAALPVIKAKGMEPG
jgi:molybdate transport system substrate-binding protein